MVLRFASHYTELFKIIYNPNSDPPSHAPMYWPRSMIICWPRNHSENVCLYMHCWPLSELWKNDILIHNKSDQSETYNHIQIEVDHRSKHITYPCLHNRWAQLHLAVTFIKEACIWWSYCILVETGTKNMRQSNKTSIHQECTSARISA